MAQQTAVEWLEQELKRNRLVNDTTTSMNISKAKQMEREQIEEAYKRGWEESKSAAIKYVEEFTTRLQNETN